MIQNHDYNSQGNLTLLSHNAEGVWTTDKNITYDANGIRVITNTDILGHTRTSSYDTYGRLSYEFGYLADTTRYQYDNFGRTTSINNPDGFVTTNSFVWTGSNKPALGVYGITQTGNDGSSATTWYDKLSRAIRSETKGFNGTMVLSDIKYNIKGQVYRNSEPYFAGSAVVWGDSIIFDSYGRVLNIYRRTGMNTSYSYSGSTISETTAGKTFTKTYAADGTLTSATDKGGTITYNYFPDGKPKSITAPGGVLTTMEYNDAARNQTKLIDPSAGTTTYTYTPLGQIKTQTNARSQTATKTYYSDGRINTLVTQEGITTYYYNTNKQLIKISSPNNVTRKYEYFPKGQLKSSLDSISATLFSKTLFTYDKGRLKTKTHPSGIVETINYNINGYVSSIEAGGATRYTITAINARQQITNATYGNNLSASFGFDPYGYPTSAVTGSIQNYQYSFNAVTGNLNSRQNYLRSLTESFTYDSLERLKTVSGPQSLTMSYNNNGNINTRSDIGSTPFTYGTSASPYKLTGVKSDYGIIPADLQSSAYTSFEKISSLSELNYAASFIYTSDQERLKMDITQNGSNILTRWYSGSSYMKETAGAVTKEFTYIGGDAYSAPVICVTQGGVNTWYYLLRDYLGNVTHQVNTSNTVVAEFSYDAWGRRRNPLYWNYDVSTQPELLAGRGFTGHEHLTWFNLINMNGRLYDPAIGRFLSPDNFVQSPTNSQNFNRYAYCLNNPLMYTDPSGEKFTFWHFLAGSVFGMASWQSIQGLANGSMNGWEATGQYLLNAAAFVVGGGVGNGVNVACAGGSFSAGFLGNVPGVSSTGFFSGFLSGASAGITSGFISGTGGAFVNGQEFGDALKSGLRQSLMQGLSGGIIGGIFSGFDAISKDVNFWTGKTEFDLSSGFGAQNVPIGNQTITGKYVGKYENVNIYESAKLGSGRSSGGITLPGRGIVVGKGVLTRNLYPELLQHEFGHILQARDVGMHAFSMIIAPESIASASMHGKLGWNHDTFWTETWSNYLSSKYFGNKYIMSSQFPIQNISTFNYLRLRLVSPFFGHNFINYEKSIFNFNCSVVLWLSII
ncbi:MAG: RHS repeat-associated core domain-containing protein [Bacteroidales bacterium]|nr:RHS repeat-associated core domain-containing protein [Bacteroidales bacterium]